MKFFKLLFVSVVALSFAAESAYFGDEDLIILDNKGTFLCQSNTECTFSDDPLMLSESQSAVAQSGDMSPFLFNFPPILGSSISPKEIYINDTVKVNWRIVSTGNPNPQDFCKVMLNNIEIAFGGYIGVASFTAEDEGIIDVICKVGGRDLKQTHRFTSKLARPIPVISITGPSGLHEQQAGEFRWSIQNAEHCERFDSVSSRRVAIGAGNGSARLAWGGVPYQWVTVTIECTGAGGFAAADTSVYIIPPNVTNPVAPKIKSFIVRSTSAFKATGSWLTERMSSCNLSSNHVGSYNKMPVPVNTPVGGYAGLNTGGTTLEVFTLECFGEDGKTYQMNARPY